MEEGDKFPKSKTLWCLEVLTHQTGVSFCFQAPVGRSGEGLKTSAKENSVPMLRARIGQLQTQTCPWSQETNPGADSLSKAQREPEEEGHTWDLEARTQVSRMARPASPR